MKRMARLTLPLLLVAAVAITALGCLLCYQYDNKYTAQRLPVSSGMLSLDAQTLAEHPVIQLVDGWELYSDRLLSPADFRTENPPRPDRIVYIGQYSGFEAFTQDGSPHGSATYRLLLDLPGTSCSYTLELPEIFSACKVYVDGVLYARIGEPGPQDYRPETLNTTITFEANGKTEIVVAVSDFSHLYSGMVYPPAFGLSNAVSQLLSVRFLFRAVLCVVALTIGLLSILIGALTRRNFLALRYGLLCLFFVGYVAYPLIKTFFSGYFPYYALENISFVLMLMMVGLLLHQAIGTTGRRVLVFVLLAGLVCIAAVVLHLSLALQRADLLPIMYAYSYLIAAFEWITAAYLTFLAIRALWKGAARLTPILMGVIVFDTALIMDRVLPLHEPIVTGWFPELASFVLVLCIGISVGIDIAEQYKNSAVQRERAQNMEHLLQLQQSYYAVLDEKMEDTRALRHDLRHHVSVLDSMIGSRQYTELGAYLSSLKRDIDAVAPKEYSKNRVVNVLANHFDSLATRQGIQFELRCDLEGELPMADADLTAILSNLLENALEACERMEPGGRFIRTGIAQLGSALNIRVVNSANRGLVPEVARDPETLFASARTTDQHPSLKAKGRTGYGLYSIRMIAKKYSGQSEVAWDEHTQEFTHSVMLFIA